MSRKANALRDEALTLSLEERYWLAEELLDSMRSDEERAIADEWLDVANHRMRQIDAGTATLVPIDEAVQHAREAVKRARRPARRS